MAGETHTPGPWKVEDGGITGPDWQLVAMPRDGMVYSEYTSDSATLEIDNPADARLIACAPEMAEALRALVAEQTVSVHIGYDERQNYTYAEAVRTDSDAFRQINAILAKIGGAV